MIVATGIEFINYGDVPMEIVKGLYSLTIFQVLCTLSSVATLVVQISEGPWSLETWPQSSLDSMQQHLSKLICTMKWPL